VEAACANPAPGNHGNIGKTFSQCTDCHKCCFVLQKKIYVVALPEFGTNFLKHCLYFIVKIKCEDFFIQAPLLIFKCPTMPHGCSRLTCLFKRQQL